MSAVPPIPTMAAAASEPEHDKLQESASTKINNPNAAITERIMSNVFCRVKDYCLF